MKQWSWLSATRRAGFCPTWAISLPRGNILTREQNVSGQCTSGTAGLETSKKLEVRTKTRAVDSLKSKIKGHSGDKPLILPLRVLNLSLAALENKLINKVLARQKTPDCWPRIPPGHSSLHFYAYITKPSQQITSGT